MGGEDAVGGVSFSFQITDSATAVSLSGVLRAMQQTVPRWDFSRRGSAELAAFGVFGIIAKVCRSVDAPGPFRLPAVKSQSTVLKQYEYPPGDRHHEQILAFVSVATARHGLTSRSQYDSSNEKARHNGRPQHGQRPVLNFRGDALHGVIAIA
jgi:hypothetical protein